MWYVCGRYTDVKVLYMYVDLGPIITTVIVLLIGLRLV